MTTDGVRQRAVRISLWWMRGGLLVEGELAQVKAQGDGRIFDLVGSIRLEGDIAEVDISDAAVETGVERAA